MTQPAAPVVNIAQAPVDPVRVIGVLKRRLAEEIAQTAVLESLLQAAQERELDLSRQLAAARPADASGAERP